MMIRSGSLMGQSLLLVLFSAGLTEGLAYSLGTAGPAVTAEATQESAISSEDAPPDLDLRMRKEKQALKLITPVGDALEGSFAVRYDVTHETRRYRGASAESDFSVAAHEMGTNAFTAIYSSEKLVPRSKVYLVAARHGSRDLAHDVRPMGEYYGVISFKLADWGYRLLPADKDATSLIMRVRNWSYGNDYLPILNQEISLGDGFQLDIGIISHVELSWNSSEDTWGAAMGVEGNSQHVPVKSSDETLWIQGSTIDAYFTLRRHVASIVHATLEGGLHRDESVYKNLDGKVLRKQRTDFTPWTRIGLRTFVP